MKRTNFPARLSSLLRPCRVLALALLISFPFAAAHAVLIVVTNGSQLTRFDSATPGTTATVNITGLQGGETLLGLDFRPTTGVLYGLGNTKRLYTLDAVSGAATQVGGVGTYIIAGGSYGTSFNPVDDNLRLCDNVSENVRINPDTNALINADGSLSKNGISAIAYSNQYPNASITTLYGLNSIEGKLVTIGPNPTYAGDSNAGLVTDVGSLNLNAGLNQTMGFDIAPDGTAYAAITFGGQSGLYVINLNTGAAGLIGTIGNGATPYRGLAVQHGPLTFTNSGVILIPAPPNTGGGGGANSTSNPYPATITTSGLSPALPIQKVTLILKDLRHKFPDDPDILLTYKPTPSSTTRTLTVLSDVGGNTSTCGANCDNQGNLGTTGVNLTLTDTAVNLLPQSTALSSGTFKPTNFDANETFPVPAPTPPYADPATAGSSTFASVFNGLDPNGTWSLYIVDDGLNDTGRLNGGWSVEIISAPQCQVICPANITVNNSPGQCGAIVSLPKPMLVSGACGNLVYGPASGSFFPPAPLRLHSLQRRVPLAHSRSP